MFYLRQENIFQFNAISLFLDILGGHNFHYNFSYLLLETILA